MAELVDTVVIGAGQAGLAMSHHLARRGREHVVLERGRIAERWRSERWDSLWFQFPNWMMRLPGQSYDGPDPDGFSHHHAVIRFIADYAARNAAPVRCGVNVTALRQEDDGRFRIEAGTQTLRARNVVVATGPYQRPRIPPAGPALAPRIQQFTASSYTNPEALPRGAVLVVGSGASGCQIVEDLLQSGRRVHYAVRGHRRVPRRYRGRDIGHWNELMGLTNKTAAELPPGFRPPLVTGYRGGHTVDLRALPARGAVLHGSLRDAEGETLAFAADLNANLDAGDTLFREGLAAIDAFIERDGVAAAPPGEFDATLRDRPAPVPEAAQLDLRAAEVGSVIWALGYELEHGWIHCDAFDATGAVRHKRGVTAVPGLFFLGLMRLHRLKSSFLWGVGEDADHVAEAIAAR